MRLVFFMLLTANALFFVYAFAVRQGSGVEGQIPLLQISPEKIRLMKPTDGVPARESKIPGASAAAADTPAVCLEWGIFAGPDVARADAALAKLEVSPDGVQRAVTDTGGYWVYIPPPKTKAEVDKKIAELKRSAVDDFFVVQDAVPWRNAISLGIFKTEEAAKTFLAALAAKGVRSAVVERREKFLKQVTYFVREPSEAAVAQLTALQRDFPGTRIKAAPCPPKGA